MKTTLITANIDGHEIVRGLGRAVVDPVKAKALIAQEMPETIESADVYFIPKAGEEIITGEEVELTKSRMEALPEKSLLTTAGDVIEDRRGEKFWHQDEYSGEWLESKIAALGEELPATDVFHKDLSATQHTEIAEQKEDMRLDALTEEERQAEYDQMLQAAQREAVFIRSEKELTGMDSAQALAEAQTWLADKEVELVEKYGIVT